MDGEIATIGMKVDGNSEIVVDGKKIKNVDKVYYLLNKPRGVVSTTSDEKERTVITSLINTTTRIYPVGRLDYDTTGAIILTNDGELANILMHPKNMIERIYYAKVEGFVTKEEIASLGGIIIGNEKCFPYNVKLKKYNKKSNVSYVTMSLNEGHNHEVKNIFNALKHPVIKLRRESFAGLSVANMKSGEYRMLSPKEVKILYSLKK